MPHGETLRDKWYVRWGVLIMIALTMLFAYMFVDVLSPLKTQLDQNLGWSSSVFGTYAGSEFFINVFCLFLIFAGIILDKMGVRFTAILSGSLMVLGAGIKVYALSNTFHDGGFLYSTVSQIAPNFPPSAALACVGFAIFGMGTEMGGVTVSRAIVKWFQGKEMAMAMGVEMAVARLGVFASYLQCEGGEVWTRHDHRSGYRGGTGAGALCLYPAGDRSLPLPRIWRAGS